MLATDRQHYGLLVQWNDVGASLTSMVHYSVFDFVACRKEVLLSLKSMEFGTESLIRQVLGAAPVLDGGKRIASRNQFTHLACLCIYKKKCV
jgi:hypothetical protein